MTGFAVVFCPTSLIGQHLTRQERLQRYLGAIQTLELAGGIPLLTIEGDVSTLFNAIPSLAKITWRQGQAERIRGDCGQAVIKAEVTCVVTRVVKSVYRRSSPPSFWPAKSIGESPSIKISYRLYTYGDWRGFCGASRRYGADSPGAALDVFLEHSIGSLSISLGNSDSWECLLGFLRRYRAKHGYAIPTLDLRYVKLWARQIARKRSDENNGHDGGENGVDAESDSSDDVDDIDDGASSDTDFETYAGIGLGQPPDLKEGRYEVMPILQQIGSMGTRLTLSIDKLGLGPRLDDLVPTLSQDWSPIYRFVDSITFQSQLFVEPDPMLLSNPLQRFRPISIRSPDEWVSNGLLPLPETTPPPIALESTIGYIRLYIGLDNFTPDEWREPATSPFYIILSAMADYFAAICAPDCFYECRVEGYDGNEGLRADAATLQHTYSNILRGMVKRRIAEARPAPGWRRLAG